MDKVHGCSSKAALWGGNWINFELLFIYYSSCVILLIMCCIMLVDRKIHSPVLLMLCCPLQVITLWEGQRVRT